MAGILIRNLFLASPMMRGGDVTAVQAALSAHGTALKVDGVFGQATANAVRTFQRVSGLSRADGIVGPETWGKLFGIAPDSAAYASVSRTCFDLLRIDWSPEQACGILGNIQHESAFNPAARGDSGNAYGLAQWHADRQKAFLQHFGRPIQNSSVEDQARFITFELLNGDPLETAAGKALQQATTPESAAEVICRRYERPLDKDGESRKRAQSARAFLVAFSAAPPAPPPAPEPQAVAKADVLSPRAIQDMMRLHGACPGGVQWALTPYGLQVDGKDLPAEAAAIARLDGLWGRYAAHLPIAARVPVELVLALLDLLADRASALTWLPGCDTLAPERTPDLVAVGPLQVTLATARTALSRPGLTLGDLANAEIAIEAGVHAIALRSRETLFDPPLVAAAHLADGLFLDSDVSNRWRLAQGGPVVLIDRFLNAFNAAMHVTGSRSVPAGLTTLHGLLETMSVSTDLPGIGPYRASDPDSWEGKPLVGSGQCVALVQVAADAPQTKFWKQGDSVQQRAPDKGTAIATFQDGRYINDTHGLSHAALFLGLTDDASGFWVIDQWNNANDHHPPQKRVISFTHAPGPKNTPANRGSAFSVIV